MSTSKGQKSTKKNKSVIGKFILTSTRIITKTVKVLKRWCRNIRQCWTDGGADIANKASYSINGRSRPDKFTLLLCQSPSKRTGERRSELNVEWKCRWGVCDWMTVAYCLLCPERMAACGSVSAIKKLNARTATDSYPIPQIDECIDSLETEYVLTTLSARSGCWPIELKENDINETALVTRNGLYKYIYMPFVLKNVTATFHRTRNIILEPVNWQPTLVYTDNVVIYSNSTEERLSRAKSFLQLINKTKCL